MKSTKQRILNKSLELFNARGIVDVSLRDISTDLNISVGNLQYHYKKREDIVEALYYELVARIEEELSAIHKQATLENLIHISTKVMKVFMTYRFFLIDFVSISRNNDRIKKHYAQLSIARADQFRTWISDLIEENVFRKEAVPDEYSKLYTSIEVISNFWFSNTLIQKDELTQDIISKYSTHIRYLIYPYLTEQGRSQFNNGML